MMYATYKNQYRVQVYVAFPHKFLVVLLCFLAEMLVEFGVKILV